MQDRGSGAANRADGLPADVPRRPPYAYVAAEYGLIGPPRAEHEIVRATWRARIVEVDPEGQVRWQVPASGAADVWRLPDGHVLYSHETGVREACAPGLVTWDFSAPDETYGCQRLPDGATLVGVCGDATLLEVERDGRIRRAIAVPTQRRGHHTFRYVRKLPTGTFLLALPDDDRVIEFDERGRELWRAELPAGSLPYSATRLANGNTLVGGGSSHAVFEFDRDGRIAWSVTEHELPGVTLRYVAGVQRLGDGVTVIVNWLGHGHVGEGLHVVAVHHDKSIAWVLHDPDLHDTLFGIALIDAPGPISR